MKSGLLLGSDHIVTGSVGEVAERRVAAALTRGGARKMYAHVDPNEDAALCAEGSRGLLVAVADGHWGHEASAAALERLRDAHAESWTEGPDRHAHAWYQEMLTALVDANDAILARHTQDRRPRTTLAIALVRPEAGQLVAASMGDSHVFRICACAAHELVRAKPREGRFLGDRPLPASSLAVAARIELLELEDTRAIAVATDGLSEKGIGVSDPGACVLHSVRQAGSLPHAERARAAARTLVEAAIEAQSLQSAGDNVAAAVAWLESGAAEPR